MIVGGKDENVAKLGTLFTNFSDLEIFSSNEMK